MTVSSVKTGEVGLSFALNNNFMEPIATTLVGSGGTNNITFNNIPQTYKHLQVRFIGRSSSGSTGQDDMFINFNSDTGSNYAKHFLSGEGSTAQAGAIINHTKIHFRECLSRNGNASSIFTGGIIDILDYTSTNKNKTTRSLFGVDRNGSGQVSLESGLYFATPASITTIDFAVENANNFVQYSRFSLYGIKG